MNTHWVIECRPCCYPIGSKRYEVVERSWHEALTYLRRWCPKWRQENQSRMSGVLTSSAYPMAKCLWKSSAPICPGCVFPIPTGPTRVADRCWT